MDANIIVPIIIAIVAAAPGALALWRQAKLDQQRQPQMEMTEGIQASKDASDIVRQYSTEIRDLRKEMRDLSNEMTVLRSQLDERDELIGEWQVGIKRLIAQLVSMGHIPVWEPKTQPLKPTQ